MYNLARFWVCHVLFVADPGFNLREGVNVWGEGRQSLNVLKVEVNVSFERVLAIFVLKLCFKSIASEGTIEIN